MSGAYFFVVFKFFTPLVSCYFFFYLRLTYGFGSTFATISKGFSFFAIGGLVNVLTTVFLVMSDVTLFLK